MAFMNDPHGTDREANAVFRERLIEGWPHAFVMASRDIAADEEVLVQYGERYWEMTEILAMMA